VDKVVCVACSKRTQIERLRVRGWSNAEIDARNQAQWPVEKKMDLAGYVIWTESTMAVTETQAEHIFGREIDGKADLEPINNKKNLDKAK
jgi:dephospho-CoA kinase